MKISQHFKMIVGIGLVVSITGCTGNSLSPQLQKETENLKTTKTKQYNVNVKINYFSNDLVGKRAYEQKLLTKEIIQHIAKKTANEIKDVKTRKVYVDDYRVGFAQTAFPKFRKYEYGLSKYIFPKIKNKELLKYEIQTKLRLNPFTMGMGELPYEEDVKHLLEINDKFDKKLIKNTKNYLKKEVNYQFFKPISIDIKTHIKDKELFMDNIKRLLKKEQLFNMLKINNIVLYGNNSSKKGAFIKIDDNLLFLYKDLDNTYKTSNGYITTLKGYLIGKTPIKNYKLSELFSKSIEKGEFVEELQFVDEAAFIVFQIYKKNNLILDTDFLDLYDLKVFINN